MSRRNYAVKLDTARVKTNADLLFYISDMQSDRFTIKVTEKGQVLDLSTYACAMIGISPSNKASAQFITEQESNILTIVLQRHMMNEVGQWKGRIILFNEEQTLVLDTFGYIVQQDELAQIDTNIQDDDRTPILTDLINQCRAIIEQEATRVITEQSRVNAEIQRVNQEQARVEAEQQRANEYKEITTDLSGMQQEFDDFILQCQNSIDEAINRINSTDEQVKTNEQERQQAENIRQSNEEERIKNELNRQQVEAERVLAEQERSNNYAAMVEAEEERVQAEELRVSAENTRVGNENTRKANEVAREKNETSRQYVFENKVNEVDKKIIEINATKDNFVSSINTKVDNKISELDTAKSDMTNTVSNKVNEVETRFNALTSSQQQDAEVIDARDGETSLKARLDRDIEKAKQVYVNVEGSNISTDSSVGYAKDVEILGNTIQDASNLADIRSVGDKVEGQELYEIPVLSVGKNIFKSEVERGCITSSGELVNWGNYVRSKSFMRVSPNTNYIGHMKYNGQIKERGYYVEYDKDFNFIKTSFSNNGITTSDSSCYIKLILDSNSDPCDLTLVSDIQLEEGTQATPYEPYKEDKLTILSPVQLERVGDVADRIIEKDGVWGVEKNIKTIKLGSESAWYTRTNKNGVIIFTTKDYLSNGISNRVILCDAFTVNNGGDQESIDGYNQILAHKNGNYSENIYISKDFKNTPLFTAWLDENPVNIKYVTETEPQFIPLPPDQQIKLRTFANKTNISFGCEIEGTIKAQVPKSLGATVNTHTEQISNLNKELDRVKKLEESTVSTVTTESDFTTVEATSNGYFEDVKLEGKTLVNILPSDIIKNTQPDNENFIITSNWLQIGVWHKTPIKPNTTYTIIVNVIEKPNNVSVRLQNNSNYVGVGNTPQGDMSVGINVFTSTTTSVDIVDQVSHNYLGFTCSGFTEGQRVVISKDIILLEGDHTQNPPSYFEGLKSVGQDVDEIVVESVNASGNLVEYMELTGVNSTNGEDYTNNKYVRTNYITVEPNQMYYIKPSTNVLYKNYVVYFYDSNKAYLGYKTSLTSEFTTVSNTKFIRFDMLKADDSANTPEDINNCDFVVSKCRVSEYIPHQSDKKRLLYYNEETQTWEKPVPREWDSIEKHADGKYYYHQRSGEVVLDGSESWGARNMANENNTIGFGLYPGLPNYDINSLPPIICDRFTYMNANALWVSDEESTTHAGDYLHIRILKSKLSTQDVAGFKQWLQANNVTVVYQLAEEKVYECTNIDLITYANETNYIVESGAIVPRTTLKVLQNATNIIRQLQQKVSILEQNESKFMQILIDLINK